jgi:hypothetical protein
MLFLDLDYLKIIDNTIGQPCIFEEFEVYVGIPKVSHI